MNFLILVPTEFERRRLQSLDAVFLSAHLCGIGPITATLRTTTILHDLKPAHVILVGIAGTYDSQRLPLGAACCFERVAIHGIGAGEGDEFISAADMGFTNGEMDDRSLATSPRCDIQDQLLTVCAASGNQVAVEQKRKRKPNAIAEDMEAYGVAMACANHNTPLTVIRGISNAAGDRNQENWRVDDALQAASHGVLSASSSLPSQ